MTPSTLLRTLCFTASFLVVALYVSRPSKAQEWSWVQQGSSTYWSDGTGIAVDAAGNSIVTGGFRGTATFGRHTLTGSASGHDAFVASYSPEGEVLWAERAGGASTAGGAGIAVDATGHSTVTGYFTGTAAFGDTTLTSVGEWDVFVARYSPKGEVLWVERVGGAPRSFSSGIAVDATGHSTVTGYFTGTAAFGRHTLTSAGVADIFVARYSPEGEVLWAQRAGSPTDDLWGRETGRGIAVDASGNAYVTGHFQGTAVFGDTTLTSADGQYAFVVKYSSEGGVLWARRAGGVGTGIAVDAAGHATVTGVFHGTAAFGLHTLTSTPNTENGFVARYSPEGEVLWAQRAGDAGWSECQGVAVDAAGNATVTGSFAGTLHTLTSAGGAEVFVVRYSPEGEVLWAERAAPVAGSVGSGMYGTGIAVDAAGNATVTGSFSHSATFGPHTLPAPGWRDVFVARVTSSPVASEPVPVPSSLTLMAFPNPAARSANVSFRLDRSGRVRLVLYDVLGRESAVPVDGGLSAGEHSVGLDVSALAPGLYVLRLTTETGVVSRGITVHR
jgi:hypothetical protein